MQSDKSMLLESGSADDEADDYCYGVQILEFEPFRTQIQNKIFLITKLQDGKY